MDDNKNLLQILSYNGLGDRLCDIIGSYIISKYLGLKLNIFFNPVIGIKHDWGINNIFDIIIVISDIECINNIKNRK